MIYLNIIYFILISWYAYKFLTSSGKIVRSPFDKNDDLALTGPEMFWVLTFSTGVLAFSAPLSIDLMAVRLLVIMVLCFIGFSYVDNKPIWSFPLKLYVVYLVWLLIGCTYGPSWGYGIRVILKYSYPLIFCLFASAAIDNFPTAFKASVSARWVGTIAVVLSFIPYIGYLIPGVLWYSTARVIHFISLMTFSMSLFFFTAEKKKNFLYTLLFLFPCFAWVFRTSIMGSGVAIMAFSIIRWKLKSLPMILGVLVAGVIAVFTIPSLHDKMFYDDMKGTDLESFTAGELNEDAINTNTRAVMWEFLEEELYKGHELTGSGTGSVQNLMYNNFLFGGLTVPHSDFVQMKCDNGLIGMYLYIAISCLIFCHCFRIYWSTDDDRVKLFAITAGASLLGVFATMYTDNTVNYSMATLSMPYGFYGMTLALKNRLTDE